MRRAASSRAASGRSPRRWRSAIRTSTSSSGGTAIRRSTLSSPRTDDADPPLPQWPLPLPDARRLRLVADPRRRERGQGGLDRQPKWVPSARRRTRARSGRIFPPGDSTGGQARPSIDHRDEPSSRRRPKYDRDRQSFDARHEVAGLDRLRCGQHRRRCPASRRRTAGVGCRACDTTTFYRVYLGRAELSGAIRAGQLTMSGPRTLQRGFGH
jgi:hypothetical protein